METTTCKEIYAGILSDERYVRNVEYGAPRPGHAEGKVKLYIDELEANLEQFRTSGWVDEQQYWKLRVLIHVHDSFKAESKRNVAITDPDSHASIASRYLAQYTEDPDLLAICQYHDLGYAVYRKFKETGRIDEQRLDEVVSQISDIDLYLTFVFDRQLHGIERARGHRLVRSICQIPPTGVYGWRRSDSR